MLFLCFIRLRFGIAMYLLYQILVPFVNINIGSVHFGQNLVNVIVFVSLLWSYNDKLNQLEYKSLLPFIFLFVAQLLLIPLHTKMPVEEQFNFFRLDIMGSLMLPFAMINVMKFDKEAYILFRNAMLIGVVIAVLYGIFLTLIPGVNPWLIAVMPLNDMKFNDSYALAENGGRLFGRISSVFSHPMTFGLFLCLSFVFTYSLIKPKGRNITYFLLLALLVIAIIVCGVRTPIGSLIVVIAFYLAMTRKYSLIIYVAISSIIIYFIIQQFPELFAYISSMFDDKSEAVSGSSNSMRLEQLKGCINTIKNNEFFGLGYGWTGYYQSLHGDHPVMLAFESLVYVVLCNSGYMGIAIWIIVIFLYYRYIVLRFRRNSRIILLSLMVTYLTYSLITGEYGYMKYFLIFYVIILSNYKQKRIFKKRYKIRTERIKTIASK